jgi:hypothetical protein
MVTVLINLSPEAWNQVDLRNKAVAEKRCPVKYADAPCLKKFIKVEPGMYRAICGEGVKSNAR